MIDCSSLRLTNRPYWLSLAVIALFTTAISAWAQAIPGIPNSPDLVTVSPFLSGHNETDVEKTRIVLSAEINGHRGYFFVDLGAPIAILSHSFLQPNSTGGVDPITDANRIPDTITSPNILDGDKVHVTMRIGTMLFDFKDPTIDGMAPSPYHYNAFLVHGGLDDINLRDFIPHFGRISLSMLEQFETIIDYTHRRIVLIRLDSAGHRMVKVPAYTPRWSAPLIDIPMVAGFKWNYWGINVRRDRVLDTLDTSRNIRTWTLDTGAPVNDSGVLGYPFLSNLGVFGLNHRTHQFILYR